MTLYKDDTPSAVTNLRETTAPWVETFRMRGSRVAGLARRCIDYLRGRGPETPLTKYRWYVLLVLIPTFVTAIYYLFIAADQYATEAHFVILSPNEQSSGVASLGQLLGGSSEAETETLAVVDFLGSQDAVDILRKQLDLVGIYRKPDIDIINRINAHPSAEWLYRYLYWYGQMIDSYYDFQNNVGVLKVYAFTPEDAQRISDKLLDMGDRLVDQFNKRAEEDALRVARGELTVAEKRVAAVQAKITDFRLHERELDLTKSTDTILDVIGKLEDSRAQAQADLTAASAYMKPDSPQFAQLTNRVKALQDQIDQQNLRLTGPNGSLAPTLAQYQSLELELQFAQNDYEAALKNLEAARLQVQKQKLFLIRTVKPNLAEESEYPRGILIVASVFLSLTVAFGIGWLILAGVREHGG